MGENVLPRTGRKEEVRIHRKGRCRKRLKSSTVALGNETMMCKRKGLMKIMCRGSAIFHDSSLQTFSQTISSRRACECSRTTSGKRYENGPHLGPLSIGFNFVCVKVALVHADVLRDAGKDALG